MRNRIRAAVLTAALVLQAVVVLPAGAVSVPEGPVETLIEGLDSPRGVATGPDGSVYVTTSGVGDPEKENCFEDVWEDEDGEEHVDEICFGLTASIARVAPDGTVHRDHVTGLPSLGFEEGAEGPSGVSVAPDGTMYVTIGLGETAERRDEIAEELEIEEVRMLGTLLRIEDDGSATVLADVAQWETENNPDGESDVPDDRPGSDSNPTGIHATADTVYVADAGGNSLLAVDRSTGQIELAAVVASRDEEAPWGERIPMQSVPTGVTEAPDGSIVFGELTGFPFPVDGANVYAVTDDPAEPEIIETGFTAGMGVAYLGAELLVVEFARHGLMAAFMDGEMEGALVRVREDGTRASLLTRVLELPGGVAVGADGMVYVANGAVFPGGGSLLRFDPTGPRDPAIEHACPTGAVPSASPFQDVAGSTHEQAITCVNWYGIFRGFRDGTFGPSQPIIRAQFASTVHRLLLSAGVDLPEGRADAFPDVGDGVHANAIRSLAEARVITGFEDGTFRPGSRITRAQAASMVVRAYELTGTTLPAGEDRFRDDDGSVHEPAINKAANAGWIQGLRSGDFGPQRDITRAQVASTLARVASTLVRDGRLELPID